MSWGHKDLIGLKGLSAEEITYVLDTATTFKDISKRDIKKVPTLRRVAIVGDIMHSRVARSNVYALKRLGAEVVLVAPKTLLPPEVDSWGVEVSNQLDPVIPSCDVMMMLRVQKERISRQLFASDREYSVFYGLNKRRVDMMKDGAVIMHPGPMNRGVEINHDAADHARAIILDQVENGVAIRMALMYLSLGGSLNVD